MSAVSGCDCMQRGGQHADLCRVTLNQREVGFRKVSYDQAHARGLNWRVIVEVNGRVVMDQHNTHGTLLVEAAAPFGDRPHKLRVDA